MQVSMFALWGIDRAVFVAKYGEQAARDFESDGVKPRELVDAAAEKGWRFCMVSVINWPGERREFHFESIEMRMDFRCRQGVWAQTAEEAIAKLGKPRWAYEEFGKEGI